MSTSNFRQMVHSIKFIEYYWSEYRRKFPDNYSSYKDSKAIEMFITKDKYEELVHVKKSKLTNGVILSKKKYNEIILYSRICKDIKSCLTTPHDK